MASSLLRGTRIIRSQHLIPSLRSLSSDSGFDYKSMISSDPLASLELVPDDTLRAGDTVSQEYFSFLEGPVMTRDEKMEAVYTTRDFVQNLIHCENKAGIIYKAINVINHHSIFDDCSTNIKLKVFSTVFDQIRHLAHTSEVFLMNIFLRSMHNDDRKKDMTKNEIISGVLDIIQSYPKVGSYKVTEETHLRNDLGFDDYDCDQVQKALYLEFRIIIPMKEVTASCKQSIDYIYNNPTRRIESEIFQESHDEF